MKRDEIQRKALEIKNYIEQYSAEKGYPPTVREIAAKASIKSTKTVYDYINRLESMGYIKKSADKNCARGLTINSKADIIKVPLIGKITAGTPITAVENIEDLISVPNTLFKSGELFMLNVSGDSMKNCGILDRDIIIVRKQSTANNGEIVAATIDDEATVKRFYKENGHIRLQPENDSFQPIIADNVEVLGVVVGLIRNKF